MQISDPISLEFFTLQRQTILSDLRREREQQLESENQERIVRESKKAMLSKDAAAATTVMDDDNPNIDQHAEFQPLPESGGENVAKGFPQ